MKYYIAYGSNLNTRQMGWRCPTAKKLHTAELEGYRLEFRGSEGNAYATISPDKDGKVPVLLWEMQPEDERQLDRYEGWPRFYRKETIHVEIEGKMQDAMVYIMNGAHGLELPSSRYWHTVWEGYEENGLDTGVLEIALERSEWALGMMDQPQPGFDMGL